MSLDGIPDFGLRKAFESLFCKAGLERSEMEGNDDDSDNGVADDEAEGTVFGYSLFQCSQGDFVICGVSLKATTSR